MVEGNKKDVEGVKGCIKDVKGSKRGKGTKHNVRKKEKKVKKFRGVL